MTPEEKSAEKAHKALQAEAARQIDIIKNASKSAIQLLATERAEAKKITDINGSNDHDLLIEVRTKLDRVLDDIQSIIASGANKVDQSEFDALKNEIHGPRENRMRSLENRLAGIWITISIYSLAIVALFGIVWNHLAK